MATFEIKNLSFTYPEKQVKALDNICLDIKQGEFALICGKSGCGKTTLLRHLKSMLMPHGVLSGEILYKGKKIQDVDIRTAASEIGYVFQSPENQVVTDKVWHELAFGLESLGIDNKTIRVRVAEMASFFGINEWFNKNTTELSGGQMQILNLASIMVMQPSVLILDEPTSQLDPIAASEFLSTVKRINLELGVTIIISEHRLEEIFPMCDRAIVMDNGKVIADDIPVNVYNQLKKSSHDMFVSMPSAMQIYTSVESSLACPLSVRDGRDWLNNLFYESNITCDVIKQENLSKYDDCVIEMKDVWFKYQKNDDDVIKDLSLKVYRGQFYCIVGGNGAGKSTALSLISGINKPYRGKVLINGKAFSKQSDKELFFENLGVLPQNPQTLFVKNTVRLDLYDILDNFKLSDDEKAKKVNEIAELVEITNQLDMHPYDLSGGEQQRAALAKILLLNPKIVLLDEPTKGMDNHFKIKLYDIIKKLLDKKVTIVMVSHDIEFCAKYADICAMFFDGSVVTYDTPNKLFSGNSFYTTAANRMSRHIFKNAVTNEDVIKLCKINIQNQLTAKK